MKAIVLATLLAQAPAQHALAIEIEDSAGRAWRHLEGLERQAYQNYLHHVVGNRVLALSDELWSASRSLALEAKDGSCSAAAELLSYMVQGYYESSLRLEVAADWHFYSPRYLDRRRACLSALGLREADYPPPN